MITIFISRIVKTLFMNFCMVYAYRKIRGKQKVKKDEIFLVFILNICISVIYAVIYDNVNIDKYSILTNVICNVTYVALIAVLTKEIDYGSFIVMLLAICITLFSFFIASAVLFFITLTKFFSIIRSTMGEYVIVGLLQCFLVHLFFKIKRFKNGFSFFREEKFYKNIRVMNLLIIFVTATFIIFVFNKNPIIDRIIFFLLLSSMILIVYLIKRAITKHYKSNMKERAIEDLKQQIEKKDSEIEELKSELGRALKINHKYNHRISAMERAISKLKFGTEFAEENGELAELVKQLSDEYKNEIGTLENIAKTGIVGIDSILEHMSNNAKKSNIKFGVEIKYNISEIIDKFIKQGKLETLLADHINDAIIAINYSNNNVKEIMVEFDKDEDIYEIRFYDTGIEFDIDTLLKLGKEQVTTHKDSGGSGIGFVTTFETLHECKGSLIIEEYEQNQCKYSKSIIIRFDNKNMYKIRSYRQDEINKLSCESTIVEGITTKI